MRLNSAASTFVRAALGIVTFACGAAAQTPAWGERIQPAQLIRVQTGPKKASYRGTFEGMRGDSLVIADSAGVPRWVVPARDIVRVDMSVGTRRNGLKGAGYGFLVGAGVGALLGMKGELCRPTAAPWSCFQESTTRADAVRGSAAAMAVVFGLPVGAIVGRTIKSPKWRPVDLTPGPRPELTFAPVRGGAAVRLSIAF